MRHNRAVNNSNVQALLNLAAGAPLAVIACVIVIFRKFTKLVKRLLIVGAVLAGVLLVNNYHLLANR